MRLMRCMFFASFGFLAAAVLFLSPASAFERAPGLYSVSVDYVLPAITVTPSVEHVAVLPDERSLAPDRMPAMEALGPIYALSLETDGQSLRRYHMRC